MVDFCLVDLVVNSGVRFDAFSKDQWWSNFLFAIDGTDIPVAIISSIGSNRLRIFKGFGNKVAEQRMGDFSTRKLLKFVGQKRQVRIERIKPGSGDMLDAVDFSANIEQGMDSIMYGFLMETIIVTKID